MITHDRLLIAKWNEPHNGSKYTVHKLKHLGESQEFWAIDNLGDPSITKYKIASVNLFKDIIPFDRHTQEFFSEEFEDLDVLDYKLVEKQLEKIYNSNKNKERSFE